ncbi:MAG: histidine phosphatase family protein [Candidatus Staskawiczbacteria bacterium]|nr:histidine phosphatase family protein [Candidatus Staskawiczbacteria bacterium]
MYEIYMKLNNKYYILRHGEALSNVKNICSSFPETFENPLTGLGIEMIRVASEDLIKKDIDLIFASDVLRTKQTAQIVAEKLNLSINFDKRLREIDFGEFNGKTVEESESYFQQESHRITQAFPEGENYEQLAERISNFLKSMEESYKGKNILIVTHGFFWWILKSTINGISLVEAIKQDREIHTGEIKELN